VLPSLHIVVVIWHIVFYLNNCFCFVFVLCCC